MDVQEPGLKREKALLKPYVWVLLFFSFFAFLFASRSFLVKGGSFFGIFSLHYSVMHVNALIIFEKIQPQ